MKQIAYLLILISLQPTFTWANLYSCKSPTGKPIRSQSLKSELAISTMIPYITSTELNRDNLESKSPILIYYAIDSSEAFMQYSVRFELAKLQSTCKRNPKVQFIGFLNSLYVNDNSFILCKDQKVTSINFRKYPKINEKLSEKMKFISEGIRGTLIYKTNDQKISNKAFKNYPLAHPDFLHDLIKLTITEKSLFPNDTYAAFVNLKSHGSEEHVLSGMHDCQKKAKELTTQKIIRNILTKSDVNFLNKHNTIQSVENNIEEYEKVISKLDLGSERGIGAFDEDSKLGGNRLNITGNGLGSAVASLGTDNGLGSKYSFGTNHIHLGSILEKLYTDGSNRTLGFLMLESCDTNRNPHIFHKNLNNIFGYYTARKSLWYRNLNWWSILEKADGLTVNMVNILQDVTAKIPNIEVVEK